MRLEKGMNYDLKKLDHKGWSHPIEMDGGYNCWDYFDGDGTYLGPDCYGVEPTFYDDGATVSVVEPIN